MPGQYRIFWEGGPGGPGVTTLTVASLGLAGGVQAFADAAHDLFAALAVDLSNDITWTFNSEVVEHSLSGPLSQVFPVTPPSSVTGGSSTSWTAGVGYRIEWLTDEVVAGRRLRGRNFFTALRVGAYDADGTLTGTAISTIETAAADYLTDLGNGGLTPVVWSRTHATAPEVVDITVPDEIAWLTSRRR